MSSTSVMTEFSTLPEQGELLRGVKLTVRLAMMAADADVCWFQPTSSALPRVQQVVPRASLTADDMRDCEELCATFLESDRPHHISPNVKADVSLKGLNATRREADVRTFAAWSVRADDQVVGALCIAQFRSTLPSPDQLRAIREAAELLSIWFGAMHTALFDEMTGLLERGYAESVLDKELRRSQRRLRPITIAMVDVDHFKKLNDALGHPAGDRALIAIAEIMSAHFERAGDVVARWGGEEFLIMQAESDREASLAQIEALLERVSDAKIPNPETPRGVVTLSAGVATLKPRPLDGRLPEPGKDLEAFIQQADEALYRAKEAGRDRVVDAGFVSMDELSAEPLVSVAP